MPRARALAVAVLLLSYGAVGARQPAVRAALPLPVPAPVIAAAAGLPSSDPSTLLLHVIRVAFGSQAGPHRRTARGARPFGRPWGRRTARRPTPCRFRSIRASGARRSCSSRFPIAQLVAAILDDRRAALLYHGLAALDDETLAWLGPDRETLLQVRQQAALFATFGRSIHVRGGRVLVPGGSDAEPLWTALTGVDPGRPAAFVQRIFRDDDGKLALLYDAIAHLDAPRQRFALGLHLPASSRDDRLRALLEAFADSRWQPSVHPFSRPLLDASVLLSTIAVNERRRAVRAHGPPHLGARVSQRHDDRRAVHRGGAGRSGARRRGGADRRRVARRAHLARPLHARAPAPRHDPVRAARVRRGAGGRSGGGRDRTSRVRVVSGADAHARAAGRDAGRARSQKPRSTRRGSARSGPFRFAGPPSPATRPRSGSSNARTAREC